MLYGLIFACLGCSNPVGYDKPVSDINQYVVYGYVTQSGLALVNKSVYIYIKDYSYAMWQCTFECKTNYRGYYRITVTFDDWNNFYYNLTCGLKQKNSKIVFGTIERIDFEL